MIDNVRSIHRRALALLSGRAFLAKSQKQAQGVNDVVMRDWGFSVASGRRSTMVSQEDRIRLLDEALALAMPESREWARGRQTANTDNSEHWIEVRSPARPVARRLRILLRHDGDIQVEFISRANLVVLSRPCSYFKPAMSKKQSNTHHGLSLILLRSGLSSRTPMASLRVAAVSWPPVWPNLIAVI